MESLIKRLEHLYAEFPTLEGDRGQIGIVNASGASKSVVNQWLSGGIKSMDIKYALAIEKNLNVSHIWLMTGKGDFMAGAAPFAQSPEDRSERLTLATLEELDLLHLFRLSNEMGRVAILNSAKRARKLSVGDALADKK